MSVMGCVTGSVDRGVLACMPYYCVGHGVDCWPPIRLLKSMLSGIDIGPSGSGVALHRGSTFVFPSGSGCPNSWVTNSSVTGAPLTFSGPCTTHGGGGITTCPDMSKVISMPGVWITYWSFGHLFSH